MDPNNFESDYSNIDEMMEEKFKLECPQELEEYNNNETFGVEIEEEEFDFSAAGNQEFQPTKRSSIKDLWNDTPEENDIWSKQQYQQPIYQQPPFEVLTF